MKKDQRHKGATVRMCSACGLRAPKGEVGFLRIVASKDGTVTVDRDGTAQGRGAYVCKSPACVEKLARSRRLPRLLRASVPESIYEELRREASSDGK